MPTKAELLSQLSVCKKSLATAEVLINAQKKQIEDLKKGEPSVGVPAPPTNSEIWRPYNATSIFNTPVPPNPQLDPNSAKLVTHLQADRGGWVPWFSADDSYSHPVYFAKSTDPQYRITLTEDWGTTTQGMSFQCPATARPERGSDGHLSVFTPDGWEYSFWQARIDHGAHTVTASFGGRTRADGTGAMGLATALGYGGAAGNITGEELKAGRIEHALFAVSGHTNGSRKSGAWSQASTASGDWPANGQRFFLQGPVSTSGLEPWQAAVVTCLSKYGLIIGDTGGGFLKAESPLPYSTTGRAVPLLSVKADGRFGPIPIDWTRMKALA